MRWLMVLGLALTQLTTRAQIGLKPLNANPDIQSYLELYPEYQWNNTNRHGKWGTADTLKLPFFEDFTSTVMYPDSSRWLDNDVYVNRSFAIDPPSIGVATFDYLDPNGKPYNSLENELLEYGDTLTSQYIDLSRDSAGVALSAGDSVYLSFYYQEKGLGDLITSNDSLKLLFRDANGNWHHIWGVRGTGSTDFKYALLPITDANFFHEGFQMRFVNFTNRWGNNNHWHLDYIFLNKDRDADNFYFDDYAIASMPSSLLKTYASMPYDHFLANTSEAADSIYFNVRNNEGSLEQLEVRHVERHNGNQLVSTNFNENAANVPSLGNEQRKMKSYDFTGLSGYPVIIERQYFVRKPSVINPVLFQSNDQITVEQEFRRHYAYDDGSAESGFGFNDLRNDVGRIVVRFDLRKEDTLRAVDFHLTYNTQDIARQRFTVEIYKDIAVNGGEDELVYSQTFIGQDIYDQISERGFYTMGLDSALLLDAGDFYIGWSQERDYNLTLGFDKNNGNLGRGGYNKNIYFNIGDGWIQNTNEDLVGAPMIRPIVGEKSPFASTQEVKKEVVKNVLYPNPVRNEINFKHPVSEVVITDVQGKMCFQKQGYLTKINAIDLKPGIYFARMMTTDRGFITQKFIKNINVKE